MKIDANSSNYYASVVRNSQQNKTNTNSDTKDITRQEKEFFSRLYPSQQDEIMNYHFYSSKGKLSGLTVGTKLDMKG